MASTTNATATSEQFDGRMEYPDATQDAFHVEGESGPARRGSGGVAAPDELRRRRSRSATTATADGEIGIDRADCPTAYIVRPSRGGVSCVPVQFATAVVSTGTQRLIVPF